MADASLCDSAHTTTTPAPGTEPIEELAQLAQQDFDAALTDEQVNEYERTQNQTWGYVRRIALVSLARSKAQLLKGFDSTDSTDALMEAMENIQQWREHLLNQAEMANAAFARLACIAHLRLYPCPDTQGA
jgi:N-acetyl-beta-hexosaminidase